MDKPFFSIIIPVYKISPEFLDACMNSILGQTFKDCEIIMIDDGSPDSCGELCDTYASNDSRIRVIHQENRGVSVARNAGLEIASGQWVLFVDADDWLELNACELLYEQLSNCDYDMLMFRGIRENVEKSIVMGYGMEYGRIYNLDNVVDKEFLYHRTMGIPARKKGIWPAYYLWDKAYRRNFLVNSGTRFPDGIAKSEDKVFILRCMMHARKVFCMDAALYHYRINEEGVCHRYSKNLDQDRLNLTGVLAPIAEQMDREIGMQLDDPSYTKIHNDYERFVFGIISDVLKLKFYHGDNPEYSTRDEDAVAFISMEPFKSSIESVPYASLSMGARVKKFLLKKSLPLNHNKTRFSGKGEYIRIYMEVYLVIHALYKFFRQKAPCRSLKGELVS